MPNYLQPRDTLGRYIGKPTTIKTKERKRRNNRRYLDRHPDRRQKTAKQYYETNKSRIHIRNHNTRQQYKIDVLTHYGNGICACVLCGENRPDCLSIDHINGGGTQHRKTLTSISEFYRLIKRQGFPEGYRTLCMNCQWIEYLKRRANGEYNKFKYGDTQNAEMDRRQFNLL